jgi:hypothetical protein
MKFTTGPRVWIIASAIAARGNNSIQSFEVTNDVNRRRNRVVAI